MQRFRSNDPWRVLWHAATSDYLLGVLLLALALALLLATFLPQTSAEESSRDVTWQAQVQWRFGDAAWFDALRSPLQTLGAFRVAHTVWFRLLLALLALSLLTRLIDSAEDLWHGWRAIAPPQDGTGVSVKGAWDEVINTPPGRRVRVTMCGDDGEAKQASAHTWVCVDRWPWGELGPLLVYLGGLLILLGLVFTALWGWQEGPLRLTAGESVSLDHDDGLTLRLQDLAPDGRRGVGQIGREGEIDVVSGDLVAGRSLTGNGVGVYLVESGTALRLRATLSDTHVLGVTTGPDSVGQEEVVLTFADDTPSQVVGVPKVDLVLLLTMPTPVERGVSPHVQVFESRFGQFIIEQDVLADTDLRVDGVAFSLTPVPFAEICIVREPGTFWVQLGLILLCAGAVLWRLWTPRRLWLCQRLEAAGSLDGLKVVGDVSLLPALGLAIPQPNESET